MNKVVESFILGLKLTEQRIDFSDFHKDHYIWITETSIAPVNWNRIGIYEDKIEFFAYPEYKEIIIEHCEKLTFDTGKIEFEDLTSIMEVVIKNSPEKMIEALSKIEEFYSLMREEFCAKEEII